MNKTLRHYRRLACRWHPWPVQFCNSIKIKSQNPLVSRHCFHMPEPCVGITASNLPPKQCLYCFITVQWVEFKITHSCLLPRADCFTHGHEDCLPGLKSFTYWLARETVLAFVWENSLSAGSKEGDVNRSVLYKRIVGAQWKAAPMRLMSSMWPEHIKAKMNLGALLIPRKLAGEDKEVGIKDVFENFYVF